MMHFRRKQRSVPELNTASLPDLIFTVLFFFMIVTHMREDTMKVTCKIPQGTELAKLKKKSNIIHLYIGKAIAQQGNANNGSMQIQINDRVVNIDDIADVINAEKERMLPEEQEKMVVAIKADKHANMATINKVKLALRQAKALRITYLADEIKETRK